MYPFQSITDQKRAEMCCTSG